MVRRLIDDRGECRNGLSLPGKGVAMTDRLWTWMLSVGVVVFLMLVVAWMSIVTAVTVPTKWNCSRRVVTRVRSP